MTQKEAVTFLWSSTTAVKVALEVPTALLLYIWLPSFQNAIPLQSLRGSLRTPSAWKQLTSLLLLIPPIDSKQIRIESLGWEKEHKRADEF